MIRHELKDKTETLGESRGSSSRFPFQWSYLDAQRLAYSYIRGDLCLENRRVMLLLYLVG